MVQSINKNVEIVQKATSFSGMTDYGQIMVGDKGFEFFNDQNVENFIQIPWQEMDYVIVSVVFKGKWIPRFAIQTKRNGIYSFASKNPKIVLRVMRKYLGSEKIVKSLSFFEVIKRVFIKKF
ncbi:DUF956 family protein [Streptococcus jiangjianxini]|uniref:DUF956 family protein n=1 Tax=Streptococcus jiangjianxini TaxID=3161189 RepID=UPI0032EE6A44